MRTSDRNGTTPSRCATAGTIRASFGAEPFGVAFTGVTRLIETVVLLLRLSFGIGKPLLLDVVMLTVPVFAPTGRPLGLAFTVTVTVPSLRTAPVDGVTVRYGLSVVTLNVAFGVRPVNVMSWDTCAVVPRGTTRSKSREVGACCGRTTICVDDPKEPGEPEH